MKKILMIFMLSIIIVGCSSKEDSLSVTCSLNENTKDTGMEIEYSYNKDNEIIKVENITYATFGEDKLKEKSLDEYYKDVENDYKDLMNVEGIEINIDKDTKKSLITLNVIVDLKKYDYEKDLFAIGNKEDYSNVKKVLKELQSYDMYKCGKVK